MRLMRQLFGDKVPVLKDRDMIESWLYQIHVNFDKVTINKDLTVDVDGHLDLNYKSIGRISRLPVQFRYVEGSVSIGPCALTTMQGAPREISGAFYFERSLITTLQYGPREVGETYSCRGNFLKTLRGAPKYIEGLFDCSSNFLTNLVGGPTYVGGDYVCSNNRITSLNGAPEYVGGAFHLYSNKIDPNNRELSDTQVEGEVWWEFPNRR